MAPAPLRLLPRLPSRIRCRLEIWCSTSYARAASYRKIFCLPAPALSTPNAVWNHRWLRRFPLRRPQNHSRPHCRSRRSGLPGNHRDEDVTAIFVYDLSRLAYPCPARIRSALTANSSRTRAVTACQSPTLGWRNSRMVGYHGLSSRCSSQRQSAANGISVQTEAPKAPAR